MSSPNAPEQVGGEGQPPRVERLFFALWPDDELRQTLKHHCKPLLRHSGGRPVALDNLHITLAFLGSVDSGQRQCVGAGSGVLSIRPRNLRNSLEASSKAQ